ncbi:hypothetical protein AAC387_Pa01g2306 [Persea americana]
MNEDRLMVLMKMRLQFGVMKVSDVLARVSFYCVSCLAKMKRNEPLFLLLANARDAETKMMAKAMATKLGEGAQQWWL